MKKTVKSTLLSIILFTLFMGSQSLLYGQTFKKTSSVKYLQLPTEEAMFKSVDVFVELDQSSTVDVLSLGLGKLAGKKGSTKGGLD